MRCSERVAARYPTIVISGRARADVRRRLRGLRLRLVVGNHGIEPWRVSRRQRRLVRQWTEVLGPQLAPEPGVDIEDKAYSLAVHYRRSGSKRRAQSVIRDAAAGLPEARLLPGKDVVNLVPEGAPHKGMALNLAVQRFGCDAAIYVGDDDTDEDVFVLEPRGRFLTIRVGRCRDSAADYFLPGQSDVDRFLRTLLMLRPD